MNTPLMQSESPYDKYIRTLNERNPKFFNTFSIIKGFINWKTKIEFKCIHCYKLYSHYPHQIYSKTCVCIKKKDKIHDYVSTHPNSKLEVIKILDEVIEVKCYCGYKFSIKKSNFLKGSYSNGCIKCIQTKRLPTLESVKSDYMNKCPKSNIIVLEMIDKTKVKCLCGCGNIYTPTIRELMKGSSCFNCGIRNGRLKTLKSTQEFIIDLYRVHGDNLTLAEGQVYDGSKLRMRFICSIHPEESILMTPNQVLGGRKGCHKCAKKKNNKGELLLGKILLDKYINVETQKAFEGLKYKQRLKFDFMINDKLIELDGDHHRRVISFGANDTMAEKRYRETIIRDEIKTEFAKVNNVSLLRIKYSGYKDLKNRLEEILNEIDTFVNGTH